MDSFAQSFTPEQIQMFKALLAMGPPSVPKPSVVETDYTTDESEFEQDSDGGDHGGKKRRGRPPLTRTPEWIAARAASKERGRGRPKVERTPEQLEAFAAACAEKEERRRIRDVKKVERDADEAIKQQLRDERKAKLDQKALEKAERDTALKAKRTEIYEKMVVDAAEYKSKWNL